MVSRLLAPFRSTTGTARWLLITGLAITVMFLLMALLAPWITPTDFNQRTVDGTKLPKLAEPSGEYWFGTNDQFYDIYSRVVWGARTALLVIGLSVAFSVVIGVVLGIVSGFVGGWTDRLLVFITDALYAFPTLLLAIVFSFVLSEALGGGVVAAALSLTVIYIPQYFRVVRNTTVSAREATYVEAARAIGAKNTTIMGRYLFGNVVQSVPVIGTLNAADALATLAGLGFLGFGIQPNEAAEWGYDIQRALDNASAGVWWPVIFPGLAIALLVIGLTLIGEGLNETINPALRRRRLQAVILPSRAMATRGTERGNPTEGMVAGQAEERAGIAPADRTEEDR